MDAYTAALAKTSVDVGTLAQLMGDTPGVSTQANRLRAAIEAKQLATQRDGTVSRAGLRMYLAAHGTPQDGGVHGSWWASDDRIAPGVAETIAIQQLVDVQNTRLAQLPQLVNAISMAATMKELDAAAAAADRMLQEAESARSDIDGWIHTAETVAKMGGGFDARSLPANPGGINKLRLQYTASLAQHRAYLDSLR